MTDTKESSTATEEHDVDMHIQTSKSQCYTFNSYVDKESADYLLSECLKLTLLENPPIKIFGRICYQKRSVGFFSDSSKGYKYSGQILVSQQLPEFLRALLVDVNKSLSTDFNGILVNLYKNGNDSIGFHSDSESDLAKGTSGPLVASISLGTSRTFRVRSKIGNMSEKSILTDHGQLLVMAGAFQKEFTHGINAEPSISEPRISLTFRRHLV